MSKPHTTTVVAVIVSAVGILVTVKGWTATAGATATWFAIAAAIYGSGIAARNLTHTQKVAASTELDREITRVIDRRKTAIESMDSYVADLEILRPELRENLKYFGTIRPGDNFDVMPYYVHRPPNQSNVPYTEVNSDEFPLETNLSTYDITGQSWHGINLIDKFINGHYAATYTATKDTTLEAIFESTMRSLKECREELERLADAAENRDTSLEFKPNRDATLDQMLEPVDTIRFKFDTELHSGRITLDSQSISQQLTIRRQR